MSGGQSSPARAYWAVAPGQGALCPVDVPQAGPDEVAVRMRASGVSRGTERLVLQGRVPQSEHARMRCPFQEGEFPFPVKYGYCAVGVVEDGVRAGQRVFVLHPHQERFVVPTSWAHQIPDAVPDARATLAANMETALNALWDAELAPDERVAVIGAGVVGLLVACLARDIAALRPRRQRPASTMSSSTPAAIPRGSSPPCRWRPSRAGSSNSAGSATVR
jgi:NADPH:quinone reductase-like Zn-dependent oxidoreductase